MREIEFTLAIPIFFHCDIRILTWIRRASFSLIASIVMIPTLSLRPRIQLAHIWVSIRQTSCEDDSDLVCLTYFCFQLVICLQENCLASLRLLAQGRVYHTGLGASEFFLITVRVWPVVKNVRSSWSEKLHSSSLWTRFVQADCFLEE